MWCQLFFLSNHYTLASVIVHFLQRNQHGRFFFAQCSLRSNCITQIFPTFIISINLPAHSLFMRLLETSPKGDIRLVELLGDECPPYGILSHTWLPDDEEVTCSDMMQGTGRSKAGYRKIDFCAERAVQDGLSHFWIDTCCIDKSSSAELSEAINSMFRWYKDAFKCYVYLSDVSVEHSQSFPMSRWFTRGWTLQELIAPRLVEFFSVEGEQLGNKLSRMQEMQDITGIPHRVLQGCCLSEFSVEERLSWSRGRTTKRAEDLAYSLLGLFDIHMPLLYGEGRDKALRRLMEEIRKSLRST